MPVSGSELVPAMWSIDEDRVCRNRTWWWWWWLLFLENPADPQRPKQLCCFWVHRNCQKALINDTPWSHETPLKQREDGVDFHGLALAWYYDGKEVHEPLYMVPQRMSIDRNGSWGRIGVKDHTIGFEGEPGKYELAVAEKDLDLKVDLTHWTDHLSGITPTGRDYKANLGYRMFKMKGMKVKGHLAHQGQKARVKGTAYFQRVRISSPTTPWFWGIFQSERGDFIDYFQPYLGPELLRRRPSENSFLGRPRRALSATIGYMDGATGKEYDFSMHMRKSWNEEGRAHFHLFGDGIEGTEGTIELDIQTYQKATWRVQQPWLRLSSTVLHYNEYPSQLMGLRMETPDGVLKREALGHVVGNTEHAWGVV